MAQKLTKVAETTTLANTDTLIVVDESAQNPDGSTGALKRIPKSSTGFAFPSDITNAINTEVSNRNTAITNAINTEVSNRNTAISNAIDTEVDNRNNAIDEAVSTKADAIVKTASGEIASFSDGGDELPMKSLKVNIVPIQSGSGDPSPSNVRPISGYSEVVTSVCGVNVWDEEWEAGSILHGVNTNSSVTLRSKGYTSCSPNTTYRFVRLSSTSRNAYVFFYDSNKTFICESVYTSEAFTFTTPSNTRYIRFCIQYYIQDNTTYKNDISINYPSTDTEYHAYNGTTYTTSLGQTVYGGTLDVMSGVLTVKWGIYRRTILASEGAVLGTYKRMNLNRAFNCDDAIRTQAISNIAKYVASYNNDTSHFYIEEKASGATSNNLLMFVPADGNDYDIEVLYPLATPIEIQLTPTEVKTLLGQNNIWANSGSVEVEYRADTTLAYNELLSLIASLS